MLGMRRSRIWGILIGETVWNSFIALLIGIPVSVFVTELISLLTVRLVGLGIIGHQFHVSISGIIGTTIGFLTVQLVAVFWLSLSIGRKEPLELLREDKEKVQTIKPVRHSLLSLSSGVLLLLCAYAMGIFGLRSLSQMITLLIACTGIMGTFLVFQGLGSVIGSIVNKKGNDSTGLFVFTGRQLQENVFCQSKSLAISSLLIFLAMTCTAYGIGSAAGSDVGAERSVDFSLKGEADKIKGVMGSEDISSYVGSYYPMYISYIKQTDDFSWNGLSKAVDKVPDTQEHERVLQWMSDDRYPFIISLSSYNSLLSCTESGSMYLDPGEVALYGGPVADISDELQEIINKEENPTIMLNGMSYHIARGVQSNSLVADRMISVGMALIVPDSMYQQLAASLEPFCWNVSLKEAYVKKQGLMQALNYTGSLFTDSGLEYESYLKGMGRNLFYIVGGSYLTLYMGILFLVISNTVMGIKFLIQQRDTKHRYKTLLMLG